MKWVGPQAFFALGLRRRGLEEFSNGSQNILAIEPLTAQRSGQVNRVRNPHFRVYRPPAVGTKMNGKRSGAFRSQDPLNLQRRKSPLLKQGV